MRGASPFFGVNMQLSEHFSDHELGVVGVEQRIIDNAQFICTTILESIRARFGPVSVHCGYRPPGHNAAVGGKPTSFHLYDGTQSAADIDCLPTSFQDLFDWIRLDSKLPFDKVILESENGFPATVHLQVDSSNAPRRQAFTGRTGDGTIYVPQTVK